MCLALEPGDDDGQEETGALTAASERKVGPSCPVALRARRLSALA